MSVKILIADDHSVVRSGMTHMIQVRLRYPKVKGVSTCNAVLKELQAKSYTHLILDLRLPDGISLEIIPTVRRLYPDLRIMIFSMAEAVVYRDALAVYEVYHYLEKSRRDADILSFVDDFLNDRIRPPTDTQPLRTNPFALLSVRQLEILHYMLSGYTTKEIAARLNLGMSTVSTMKGRIYEKTGTANTVELVQLAQTYKLP